ncbi:hypothetical protein HQ496_06275 [bacterium]|nr:hypothetical protein [bacterium]
MNTLKKLAFSICILLFARDVAYAQFNAETVHNFLDAQTEVYRTGSPESVERFVSYMSEDVKDFHVAFGREFSGKDFFRENMPRKSEVLISYEKRIGQITMGTNVAIAIYHEKSSEKKADGIIKDYEGRTIMVIDFDDQGLITAIRRYQD